MRIDLSGACILRPPAELRWEFLNGIQTAVPYRPQHLVQITLRGGNSAQLSDHVWIVVAKAAIQASGLVRLGGRRDWVLEVTEMELMRSCS
jgi:hypothetical protein